MEKGAHPAFIRASVLFRAHQSVADVAAAAACDKQFFANFPVVVKERYAISVLSGSQCRKYPRRPCPNDRYLHNPIIQRKPALLRAIR